MYVCERFTRAVLPPKWLNFRMRQVISPSLQLLSTLCQGPSSGARYKRRAEVRPGCTILCTLATEAQVWGQSTAVSSEDFLLDPLNVYLVNRAEGGSRVACTGNKE